MDQRLDLEFYRIRLSDFIGDIEIHPSKIPWLDKGVYKCFQTK